VWKDPVVDEVRSIRDAYAKQFNYDLAAMARDLREKEAQGGRTLLGPSPRKAEIVVPDRSAEVNGKQVEHLILARKSEIV